MWKIPLSDILLDNEIKTISEALRSGRLSMGSIAQAFKAKSAEYLCIKHTLAVSNCTAALHIAHAIHGAGHGDEVHIYL